MTLNDLQWLSEIFNDTKYRAAFLWQLSLLLLLTYLLTANIHVDVVARWTWLARQVRSCRQLVTCPAGWCGICQVVPCHPQRQVPLRRQHGGWLTRTCCGRHTGHVIRRWADISTTSWRRQTPRIDMSPMISAGWPATTAVSLYTPMYTVVQK